MLKNLFAKKEEHIIPASRYGIREKHITDHNALRTVKHLQKNGYQAYIVGGAMRDIMLGFRPKDFDITTNATLKEIMALFTHARIVGQRYPIAHIYYPDKKRPRNRHYVEVAVLEGSAREDAHRRDFTINGLLYDPVNEKIYDYVNGCNDILNKKLRLIGSAKKRLPEDPVRILRALRLSTKLGLTMSAQLEQQLVEHVALLSDISSSRLADELKKVFYCGAGARILQEWQQFKICDTILPILQEENPMFFSVLAENDRRLAEQRTTSYSFIVAALFWQAISKEWYKFRGNGLSPIPAMEQAIQQVNFRENNIIPQRRIARAKDLYFLQAQMETSPTPRRAYKIIDKPFFDRALAFATMRQDPDSAQTASWWSQFVQGKTEERERLLQSIPKHQRRRRRRSQKKSSPAAAE